MNPGFKKRWLYIFSNKKAQISAGEETPNTALVWLILAILLMAALIAIIFGVQNLIRSHSP